MVNHKAHCGPVISYRPIRPSDLAVIEKLHGDLFPIRYEPEFFQNVVDGRDIVSWGVVDHSRSNAQSDELIGFVTARVVLAQESEIEDLLSLESSKSDKTLVYILTLGVLESYRNLGIAKSLIHEVIKFASNIPTCRAVYLHVISYNHPAIQLYNKMSFQCSRKLYNFYLINGQHFDSFLFVYFVNGGRSSCSPLYMGVMEDHFNGWELVSLFFSYVRKGFSVVSAKLNKNEEKKFKLSKCKEYGCLLPTVQNKRIVTGDGSQSFPICAIL